MGGDDDRHAPLPGQADDELTDLCSSVRVEPVGRLVQQYERRVGQKRHGQSKAPLHPHRAAADLHVLLAVHANGIQGVLDTAALQTQVGGHHGEVLPAGQSRVVGGILDERADGSRREAAVDADGVAQNAHVARRRADQSQQEPHRGGLAGAVGAEEPVDASGGHPQVQPVDDLDALIGAGQAVGGHRELSDRGREGLRGGGGHETWAGR